MKKQEKKERLQAIAALLRERYPHAACALEYGGEPWRLLVMGRLSAQCTDARVNLVAVPLFAASPTPAAMAAATPSAVEAIIRPCGLFRTKARDLITASAQLLSEFSGRLPETREELMRLAGVGRKIANLLLGDIYGQSVIVADTHCIRLAGRWGFTAEGQKNPLVTEKALSQALGSEDGAALCHRIVLFGREVCTARAPACHACPLLAARLCRFGERKG